MKRDFYFILSLIYESIKLLEFVIYFIYIKKNNILKFKYRDDV